MVVDDDQAIRTALGSLLTNWGVRFEAVASAAEALSRVDGGERYGLVLSDYRLGGTLNGLDLIAAITARHAAPHPLAVLITGDVDAGLMATAQSRGVPLLIKPLGADTLRMCLGV